MDSCFGWEIRKLFITYSKLKACQTVYIKTSWLAADEARDQDLHDESI